MFFGFAGSTVAEIVADRATQLAQPQSCPGKLNTQDRKSDGDHDQSRTRGDDHYYAYRKHRAAQHGDDNAPCSLVSQVDSSLNHEITPGYV